jgi:LPXTG-motif cell wall-anchored protein
VPIDQPLSDVAKFAGGPDGDLSPVEVVDVAELGDTSSNLVPHGTVNLSHFSLGQEAAVVKRCVAIAIAMVFTAGVALFASSASANPTAAPGAPREDVPSEVTMTGTGPGHGVSGFIGPVGQNSDPSVPYPVDTTGFTALDESFAGVILAAPPGGSPTLQMYCIDIRTPTGPGYGYNLGTWDEANVTNVGFVAHLLNEYYPAVEDAPMIGTPGIANSADQAAAVQAAIWYFSDNYVLAPGDLLLPAVTSIVNTVRLEPPLPAPSPPTLQIVPPPSGTTGIVGSLVGPYTITSPQGPATVSATDADMFSDAAGTTPIANGATVTDGAQIWLQRTTLGPAKLGATASTTVPSGNVYIYNGNIAGVTDAQNLILAQSSTVTTTVDATAEFVDSGALVVTKTIAGPGAGSQGEVRITVTCNGTALPDFVIPAGTTGTVTKTYEDIATPAECTITETVDGANAVVTVVTVNGSQTVAVPADETTNNPVNGQPITDTYGLVPVTTTTTPSPPLGEVVTVPPAQASAAASTQALPVTGDNSRPIGLAGLVAVAAGAALVLRTRRRTTR